MNKQKLKEIEKRIEELKVRHALIGKFLQKAALKHIKKEKKRTIN